MSESLKVFVARLPLAWGEGDIKRYFEPHGVLLSVSLFVKEGRSRIYAGLGCAYVTFAHRPEAEATIRALSKSGNLQLRWADGEQERLGLVPVVTELKDINYVEYVSEGRPYYWNSLTNSSQWDRPLSTPIARISSSSSPPSNPALSGTNLFIFHLPNEWNDEDLIRSFTPFGNVVSARIMTDRDTGRSRGFGFVSYDSPQSAQSALRTMNGFSVLGKRLKVQFKKDASH